MLDKIRSLFVERYLDIGIIALLREKKNVAILMTVYLCREVNINSGC